MAGGSFLISPYGQVAVRLATDRASGEFYASPYGLVAVRLGLIGQVAGMLGD